MIGYDIKSSDYEMTIQYLKAAILKTKVCLLIHIKQQIYNHFVQV